MQGLDDLSFELSLTDPPYGLKFKGKFPKERKNYSKGFEYTDGEFIGFTWMDLILKKSVGLCFTPGIGNLYKYILHLEPTYQIKGWYKNPNPLNRQNFDPILCYGKISRINKWGFPVWYIPVNPSGSDELSDLIHPCPKSVMLWKKIALHLRPTSIIDPFLGTGTTAQVCEEMGIKWLGFEIKEEYAFDIERRIQLGQKNRRRWLATPRMQKTLFEMNV